MASSTKQESQKTDQQRSQRSARQVRGGRGGVRPSSWIAKRMSVARADSYTNYATKHGESNGEVTAHARQKDRVTPPTGDAALGHGVPEGGGNFANPESATNLSTASNAH